MMSNDRISINGMNKKLYSMILLLCLVILCGCGSSQTKTTEVVREGTTEVARSETAATLNYRCASKEEGKELLLSNDAYFEGFSQNDLDYRMQKKESTKEEFLSFAGDQVLDFTQEEKTLIDDYMASMAASLKEKGYTLPAIDEIVFIKTTMNEEGGAGGYTHGTQIYLSSNVLNEVISGDEDAKESYRSYMDDLMWHELFHCLTRCNPDFREKMYNLIHFTVMDKDYTLPPSVEEYHISNPDVEHHDSYAAFHIDGEDKDCFVDFVTTKHFEKEGDTFFDSGTTALIPTDGSDQYYTPDQADNFNEVFGTNTDYVIDPEECMAENFAFAMLYGMEGPEGKGYPNPEIIEGIISYLKGQ